MSSIAIIAPDMHSGGSVGSVAWRHASLLGERHTVYVITRAAPPSPKPGIQALLVRHANWNWLRRFCHVPNELSFLRAARRTLAALCQREPIDVVWCHSHGAVTLVAAPLRPRFGFRVIMTTHGDIFDRPSGTYSRELAWFYKAVTPRAYRESDFVQALSASMATWAMRGGAQPDRVRLIPNGVDPQETGLASVQPRPVDSFMPRGLLRLLYVGSLWHVKGVDILLEAVARLLDHHAAAAGDQASKQALDLTLILVGDGPSKTELETLAEKLRLRTVVTFRGRLPRTDLARVYAEADILCVPSRSEALSTAGLEGMLAGLPLVGSNTGGIPMLIDDGLSGYLATPGDPDDLALALRKASASREHLAELGARGQAKALNDFGWSAIAKQLDAVLADATALPHPAHVANCQE